MEEADFDKVYLLGMFEDKFPYARQESWIYNDQERQSLKAIGRGFAGNGGIVRRGPAFLSLGLRGASGNLDLYVLQG
jgi:ATP-dependent helicase/DNAse subunit B